MLPLVKTVKMNTGHFPTRWQAVIFRNYGHVRTERLAAVLSCDESIVEREAERLGLGGVYYDENWEKRGYITIIRDNWFLLPYAQICTLLSITERQLQFYLEKEDFLFVKLGDFKPECEEVRYAPLTDGDMQKTAVIADTVRSNLRLDGVKPFSFFNAEPKKTQPSSRKGVRIVHGYLAPCGDVFSVKNERYLPDALLQKYAENGVNGLWFHGLLSTLSPYPFNEALCEGYEERRRELADLVSRCKRYGVKVYLYLNEPRALDEGAFGKYAYLMGRREGGVATLCFERKEVQEYLYGAVKDLLAAVPDLGGFLTITMSENPTHCNYLQGTNCPICQRVPAYASAAKVNNVIARAARDSGTGAEVIANLWGWSPYMGWTQEETLKGVDLLDEDVSVMCVSEYDLDIEKGGVKSRIIDYSISNPCPSEITKKTLGYAREKGRKIYAKIQINNSWECSAVPYLPVFDLTYRHLERLLSLGVNDVMMTWTLGGYPSPTTDMAAEFFERGAAFDLSNWYARAYGEQGEGVHRAVELFCAGFEEYPFSIQSLYFSPKTLGAAHLWECEPSEKLSTMVCFSYDDFERWIYPYPYETYLSQYEKLLKTWGQGLDELQKLTKTEKILELETFARAAYLHFKADALQTQFSKAKRDGDFAACKELIAEDEALTKELIALTEENPYIGFEASNHYFYSRRNLIEKLVNLQALQRQFYIE